jgi:hypothetical protein
MAYVWFLYSVALIQLQRSCRVECVTTWRVDVEFGPVVLLVTCLEHNCQNWKTRQIIITTMQNLRK